MASDYLPLEQRHDRRHDDRRRKKRRNESKNDFYDGYSHGNGERGLQSRLQSLNPHQVITTIQQMGYAGSETRRLSQLFNLNCNLISLDEESERFDQNHRSKWGPCTSDLTLQVDDRTLPVIRDPNYAENTWTIPLTEIPLIIGNQNVDGQEWGRPGLKNVMLKDYLGHFHEYLTRASVPKMNLLRDDPSVSVPDSSKLVPPSSSLSEETAIISAQSCFLPYFHGKLTTQFNLSIFNHQSNENNPAILCIVVTKDGSSAQIIEGTQQKLIFNLNGMKSNFIGRRKNVYMGMNDDLDSNLIMVIQIPLKQRRGSGRKGGWLGGILHLSSEIFDGDESGKNVNELNGDSRESGRRGRRKGRRRMETEERHVPNRKGPDGKSSRSKTHRITKVSPQTVPICSCKRELYLLSAKEPYGVRAQIACDSCGRGIESHERVWHCLRNKDTFFHRDGFDLCTKCGNDQLAYDELNGLTKIERDPKYPIRITFQFYHSSTNGHINSKMIIQIAEQLHSARSISLLDHFQVKREDREDSVGSGDSLDHFNDTSILEDMLEGASTSSSTEKSRLDHHNIIHHHSHHHSHHRSDPNDSLQSGGEGSSSSASHSSSFVKIPPFSHCHDSPGSPPLSLGSLQKSLDNIPSQNHPKKDDGDGSVTITEMNRINPVVGDNADDEDDDDGDQTESELDPSDYILVRRLLNQVGGDKYERRYYQKFLSEEMDDSALMIVEDGNDLISVICKSGPRLKFMRALKKYQNAVKEREKQIQNGNDGCSKQFIESLLF